uniref:EF-hand domain-containing protein n=1 Tax=Chromera velia CCMP2878 TaxID=1169474 RepID=A0A0G4FF05_9ALVE|mmetsp:Transcript_18609/g.37667  ORF Transcript_18609/g.37667 Transcript_18609/m.37667 type:complete len:310 (+) Transcript_18609:264-1193(+)|eukprot:Cvel_16604.t1-p1 / transcript=Cvel_16604.t1 / gene=Cvel_16604 / organism=Chromera_velia_CCMP2878 / gene_product=hypothetical protein / transcript_product=hypothetical protein / location=Cvel_scaffold1286:19626-21690(-) / protein_length=309 / sequence_SO=supercontig / SO=protein_coding / is_pseudo=false
MGNALTNCDLTACCKQGGATTKNEMRFKGGNSGRPTPNTTTRLTNMPDTSGPSPTTGTGLSNSNAPRGASPTNAYEPPPSFASPADEPPQEPSPASANYENPYEPAYASPTAQQEEVGGWEPPQEPASSQLTREDVLQDPEACDFRLVSDIFEAWDPEQSGRCGLDSIPKMRDFLLHYTTIKPEEFDEKVMTALDESMTVPFDNFMDLLRSNAISEQRAISVFTRMEPAGQGEGGDLVSTFDARNVLRQLGERRLAGGQDADEATWESALDAIFRDADMAVNMEQFVGLYGKLATVLRGLQLLEGRGPR